MDTVEQVKEKIRRLKDFLVRCKEVEDKSLAATKELSVQYQRLNDLLNVDYNSAYRCGVSGGQISISGGMSIRNEISLSNTKNNIEVAIAYYRQQLADLEGF